LAVELTNENTPAAQVDAGVRPDVAPLVPIFESDKEKDIIVPSLMDESRIHEKASRYYYRNNIGGYKGHAHGIVTGAIIGAALGAIFGAMALAVMPFFVAGASVTLLTAAPLLAATMFGGAAMISKAFGIVGSAAGSRAYSLAEKHSRELIRVPKLEHSGLSPSDYQDEPTYEGRYNHHYEIPPNRDRGVNYHFRTGAIGAGISGILGFLGAQGMALNAEALGAAGIAAGAPGFALATTALMTLLGASFGINRSLFRDAFNWTDGLVEGTVKGLPSYSLEKELARAKTPQEKQRIIKENQALWDTQEKRQKLMSPLMHKYYDLIFWNSIGGRFRGFVGGPIVGAAVGVLVGAALAGALLMSGGALAAAAPLVAACTTAAGALMGLEIFTETGTEAGAEAMSKAIDEEHRRNRRLIRQGVSPDELINKVQEPKKPLYNFKSGLLMSAVGVTMGALVAPLVGGPVLGLFSGAVVGHHITSAMIAASMLLGGGLGSTFGLNPKRTLKPVGDFVMRLSDSYGFHRPRKEEPKVTVAEIKGHTPDTPASVQSSMPVITPEEMEKLRAREKATQPNFVEQALRNTPMPAVTPLR